MKLNQPYYIDRRKNSIDLNGEWEFFWSDEVCENITENKWKYKTTLPKSIYHSLHEAGVLPDPYVGVNSKQYYWVDEKIWYYRKKFVLNKGEFNGNAYLSFLGVAYYCRLWVNGQLIGDHEGMFGGPVCDIIEHLDLNGENEIVVEVKACNYGVKDTFDPRNEKTGENTQIIPWNTARDYITNNEDFIVVGIWNKVRLDLVEKIHISRPYMYTQSISDNKAEMFFELEIADGQVKELMPYKGYEPNVVGYTWQAYWSGLICAKSDRIVELRIKMTEPDTGKIAYESIDKINLNDLEKSYIHPDFYELQFFSKNIIVENPRLWYPIGLGEPYLYKVEAELWYEGVLYDSLEFMNGIRLFESRRTEGEKVRTRWENFRFSVNGKDFFLKGINWAPIDLLYNIDEKEYEWILSLAKNAGIQMLRVWSGGGMPETDTFYELCDKMGIMVWQDHMMANTADMSNISQEVYEAQEAYNVYRIRNHPSLVIHCGGNENNPYSTRMAHIMFVLSRVLKDLDPSRIFHYNSPDRGSIHLYRNMEPVWYRHIYKHIPFVGESGIHSFPSFATYKQLVSEEECNGKLPDIASEEFQKNYPEILNHFTEYAPYRIPVMLSRASQICNLEDITLKDLCEASHVSAYEFYNLMIQSMRENYPYCGGILPWLFKRPWATAGIQTVDGCGRPVYPYYAVLNTYKPLNICLCQKWSIIAPNEPVELETVIFNENNEDLKGAEVTVTVYNPDLTVAFEKKDTVKDRNIFGEFIPDDSFTNQCFVICADISREGKSLSRTCYFVKCTDMYADKELYEKYRSGAHHNLYFKDGPWLKDSLTAAKKAKLEFEVVEKGKEGIFDYYVIKIKNNSENVAYPVTVDVTNSKVRFYADCNFFMLKPYEEINVKVTCDGDDTEFVVNAWNE